MKKIKFTYLDEYSYRVCEHPKPATQFIPQWFKDMAPYEKSLDNPEGNKIIVENMVSNASAKKCIPMRDAMTSGYIIPLWSDVQVRQDIGIGGIPKITWRVQRDVFGVHGQSAMEIPPPPGYDSVVYKFVSNLRIETPPGYSILVSSPFGHNDLPFLQIPAIIDSDKSVIDMSFPVWIKSGLEGIIEKGTPIVQITPFKREDWKSEVDFITKEEFRYQIDKGFHTNIVNNYIRNIWSRKTYK
jgi:hypothetical protein